MKKLEILNRVREASAFNNKVTRADVQNGILYASIEKKLNIRRMNNWCKVGIVKEHAVKSYEELLENRIQSFNVSSGEGYRMIWTLPVEGVLFELETRVCDTLTSVLPYSRQGIGRETFKLYGTEDDICTMMDITVKKHLKEIKNKYGGTVKSRQETENRMKFSGIWA